MKMKGEKQMLLQNERTATKYTKPTLCSTYSLFPTAQPHIRQSKTQSKK
jgi:hypothetical protein